MRTAETQTPLRDWMIPGSHPEATPARTVRRVYISEIQRLVTRHYGVSMDSLVGHSRKARIATIRHIAMHLCYEHSEASMPMIATAFRRRDHTSVMYARRKVQRRLLADPDTRVTVNYLEFQIARMREEG